MEENEKLQENEVLSKKDKLKKIFTDKNFVLRILSFLCALLLWFYVSEVESPTAEKTFESVSVTVKNKDVLLSETELSLISDAIYETNIVLSGKKRTLNKVDYDNISASVDLSRLTEAGIHELSINVVPPSGTNVVSVNPRYITVSVDKTIASTFDIVPDVNYNNLPSDYTLGDCVITDSQSKVITSVTVSGPETEIQKIDKVVARVDFGSINGSVEAKTALTLLDLYGEEITGDNIRLSNSSVKVKQPVYVTKTLPLRVAQAGTTFSDNQISFNITPSRVEVKGDPKILSELDSIQLDPINEKAIGETLTTTVNSLIKLPDGLELLTLQNTATITAKLRNVKCHELTVTPDSIKVNNLPENMDIEFHDIDSKIIVINSSNKDITLDDISLSLDLSTYSSTGLYTVFLTPSFKEELSYAYLPYANFSVTFELTEKDGAK
ncbi:MAG: hypothetical protein IJ323_01110 [Clostridia bacterium]|nr:hypothetical protein [Clostridia bacterium]